MIEDKQFIDLVQKILELYESSEPDIGIEDDILFLLTCIADVFYPKRRFLFESQNS